jgi:hypothetical protein
MRSSQRTARLSTPLHPDKPAPSANPKRRGFLLALGVGGAGAAALVARSLSGVAPNAAATPGDAEVQGTGYRATYHVKRYYRTAKV